MCDGFDEGHLQINTGHIFATGGIIRAQGALPTSDTDGSIHIGHDQLSFFDVTTPISQGAAVADATGAGDVVAQLNALLARIRAFGLIAT